MYVHKRCVPEGAEQDLEKQAHGYCGVCNRQGTIFHVVGTEDSYKTKRQGVTYVVRFELDKTDASIPIENSTDTLVLDDIAPVEMAPEAESPEGSEATVEAPTEAVEVVEEAAIPEEKAPEETPLEAEPEAPKDDEITEVLPTEKAKEEEQETEVHGEGSVSEGLGSDTAREEVAEEQDSTRPEPEAMKQQAIGEAAILEANGAVPTEEPLEAVTEPSEPLAGADPQDLRDRVDLDDELEEKQRLADIARLEAELEALRK